MGSKLEHKTASSTLGSDYSYTTNFDEDIKLHSITIHFSANYNKTITVVKDSASGSNYDVELASEKMKNGEDFIYSSSLFLRKGDEIKVTIEEKSGSVTGYIEILAEYV